MLFHEPSLWGYVGAAVSVLLVQGGFIGVLVQRAQRRRAQRNLPERPRFETLAHRANLVSSSAWGPAVDLDVNVVVALGDTAGAAALAAGVENLSGQA